MTSLPNPPTFQAYQAWRADTSHWLPVTLDIAHGHGLPTASPHIFATGTNLVIGLGDDVILKMFPPIYRDKFVSERVSLTLLRGQLGIPVPELLFEGERDRWPYLVMTRLSGVLGSEAWPTLSEGEKERVLGEIGAMIAQVQRVPVGELTDIEPRWDRFIATQIAGCRARHTRLGLPQKFLDGLDELLREAPTLIPLHAPPVMLTGEYIPENFMMDRDGDGWRLAGLFDFGDVMAGWGEYDLLGPSVFMSAGRPRRIRGLIEGFGYSAADIDATFRRRMMALSMLHRASDPLRHISVEGWQHKADNLLELQDLIWPV
jgi:hygromycin-B 7''-O-kinase